MQKHWEEALTAVENPTYQVYSRLCTQGMYTKYFAQDSTTYLSYKIHHAPMTVID
jgi:hypothetical protein